MKFTKGWFVAVAFAFVQVVGATAAWAAERPSMHAIRVADGAITLDGKTDDWSFAYPASGYVMTADGKSHLDMGIMRGEWTGKDDLSFRVITAVDSKNLYVLAFVRDSLLFNGGDKEEPKASWRGDDLEIFIDANPAEKRFQKDLNENTTQLTFVPEHLWAGEKGTPIWGAWGVDKIPGVRAASRLTPTGYVLEVAIPKELFPNWKAHPDLDSIGFDVLAGDLDTPGVIGHDPAEKGQMFLLDADAHFLSPEKLGALQLDAKEAAHGKKVANADAALPGYSTAQAILDHWDSADVEAEANAALKSEPLACKSALLVFSKRPELAMQAEPAVAYLKEKGKKSAPPMLDGRGYAMLALAERHELPAAELFDSYATNDDVLLRQTFFYSLGVNGDKAIADRLAAEYPKNKSYTQDTLAVALAQLGNKTGVPTLKAHVASDTGPGQPFGITCAEMLKSLGVQ